MDDNGWTAAPARYTAKGRETIDRMRDLAHAAFDDANTADRAFAFFCLATAMKYEDRAGRKGDALADMQKAAWYVTMADHVLGFGEDPRANREQFAAWAAQPIGDGATSDEIAALITWLRDQ